MKYTKETMQHNPTLNRSQLLSFAVIAAVILTSISAVATTITAHAAGSASFSLAPSASSVTVNSDVTVAVNEDSGSENINAVSVKLSYNAAQLSFKSISSNGSAFSGCLTATGDDASGTVQLVCYMAPPNNLTGSKYVANVVFTAKASSGTANILFVNESASNSRIAQSGTGDNIWNGNTAGTSLTLKPVVTTPPPQPPTGGGGGNTTPPPASGGTTTPPPASTPKTNTPKSNTPAPSNVTTSPASELVPVAAPNATGKSVSIFVSDANSKAVAGAKVTLGSKTYLTDANGIASFGDIKPGKYTVKIVAANGSASKSFTVTPVSQDGTAQKVEVVVKKSSNLVMLGAIGLGAVFVLTGGVMIFRKWQMNRMMSLPSGAASEVVVNKPPEAIAFEQKPISTATEKPAETPKPAEPEAPKPEPAAPVEEKEPEIDEDAAAELLKKAHVTESAEVPNEDAPAKADKPAEPEAPKPEPTAKPEEAPTPAKPAPVVSAETSPTDAPKPAGKVETVMVTPAEPKT